MPAATKKAELIAAFDKELSKLRAVLSGIDDRTAALSAPGEVATIRGVVAHRSHWMLLFLGWYAEGVAGRDVHVPAKGYKWNQLKPYNAQIYAKGEETPWGEVLAEFDAASAELRAFIDRTDNDELYGAGVYPWTGKWTVGRYAESAGPAHFRSALKYIRKVLRNAG